MRRRSAITFNRAICCLAILGTGVIVFALAGSSADRGADPRLSPADVIAWRFPEEGNEAAAPAPVELRAALESEETRRALFDPHPTYPQMAAAPPPSAQGAPPPPVAAARKPAIVASDRSSTRPGAVLNDAQIASIKQRLHLTADQEKMWPSVEVALRKLAYAKNQTSRKPGAHDGAVQVATIDSGSADLTSAAFPLIMSFSDDQKRELRTLAHVAGLEKLVPHF